ncbi:MAG TPA: hypothetical protein VFX07_14400 [Candidatus Udaeobacter sp.]|jgi:hypothetical protein|nr:hypothetical protein [Candidatus Udaeobacter sp.]HEX5492450.1 hypothetical protein [Candidatus Udaeobacter sp.]
MNRETQYTEVKEIVDDPKLTNSFISGAGWDLLTVGNRKRQLAVGIYTDLIVYVIGHRADAQ